MSQCLKTGQAWTDPRQSFLLTKIRWGRRRVVFYRGNILHHFQMVPLNWTSEMRLQTYRDMSKFVGQEVGSLGVCNFSYRQLVELLEFCEQEGLPRPTVLQNECHPLLTAQPVRDLCHQQGIVFQAYASLGAGALGLMENKTVSSVANSHGVTEAQVRTDLSCEVAILFYPPLCRYYSGGPFRTTVQCCPSLPSQPG